MNAIKAELQARLAELRDMQAKIETHRRKELPGDSGEAALQLEGEEVVAELGERVGRDILAVTAALARVDAGTYGVCAECGEEIDPRRLKILPSADKCTEHAS